MNEWSYTSTPRIPWRGAHFKKKAQGQFYFTFTFKYQKHITQYATF